jgi:ABC-2 type transport system permease protein
MAAGTGHIEGGVGARLTPDAGEKQWDHFLALTTALAGVEFKLRYFGSVLGYLWTFLRPLMLFGVLYVVFTEIVRFGNAVPHYPVMLLSGIVLYQFFAESTSAGLSSLVDREGLLRKVSFPRASIPIAVTLTAAANLGLGLLVVVLLAFIDGVDVRATWLLVPFVVLTVIVLAMSISMLLSVLYVRFRDVRPIWEVLLQLVFWGSPIIYTIESVPDGWRELEMCSPFAAAIQQIRHWFVDVNEPSAWDAIGGGALILIPIAIFFVVLLVSYWTFVRMAPHVAEDL